MAPCPTACPACPSWPGHCSARCAGVPRRARSRGARDENTRHGRGARRHPALRRADRRLRRELLRRRGRDPRHHRPERRGQDDAAEHPQRSAAPHQRLRHRRRRRRHALAQPQAGGQGPARPDLPDRTAVLQHDRAREPDDRRAYGRLARRGQDPRGRGPRPAGADRAGRRARHRPVLRPAAAGRAGPGDGGRPGGGAARRAGRLPEPAGAPRTRRHPARDEGLRGHGASRRAPHGPRPRGLPELYGARLRQGDQPRHPRRGHPRPAVLEAYLGGKHHRAREIDVIIPEDLEGTSKP